MKKVILYATTALICVFMLYNCVNSTYARRGELQKQALLTAEFYEISMNQNSFFSALSQKRKQTQTTMAAEGCSGSAHSFEAKNKDGMLRKGVVCSFIINSSRRPGDYSADYQIVTCDQVISLHGETAENIKVTEIKTKTGDNCASQ